MSNVSPIFHIFKLTFAHLLCWIDTGLRVKLQPVTTSLTIQR